MKILALSLSLSFALSASSGTIGALEACCEGEAGGATSLADLEFLVISVVCKV